MEESGPRVDAKWGSERLREHNLGTKYEEAHISI